MTTTAATVVLEPYEAEFCDINIYYASGKGWAKFLRVDAARTKARQATGRKSTTKVVVRICTGVALVGTVNYHRWDTHTWTPDTGWVTTTDDDTNNGQGV